MKSMKSMNFFLDIDFSDDENDLKLRKRQFSRLRRSKQKNRRNLNSVNHVSVLSFYLKTILFLRYNFVVIL